MILHRIFRDEQAFADFPVRLPGRYVMENLFFPRGEHAGIRIILLHLLFAKTMEETARHFPGDIRILVKQGMQVGAPVVRLQIFLADSLVPRIVWR